MYDPHVRLVLAIAVWLSALGGADARDRSPIASPRRVPRPAIADAETLARASQVLSGSACRDRLLEELRTGRGEATGCAADRRRLARSVVLRDGVRFGYVERSDVQLWAVELVLGEAVRCRAWPVRGGARAVLDPRDVAAAGCRARRHHGPVAIELVDDDGRRARLPALRSDRDGRLRIVITEIDAAARFAGLGDLRRWRFIEVGERGWGGRIDLHTLHEFLADWHLRWVKKGRGVPGLFAIAHPEHADADEARALAVEARIARERADAAAVERGAMSRRRFLTRHPGSAYRRTPPAVTSSASAAKKRD